MKITIVSVGKLKEKFWRDAAAEYQKRLQSYCKLEIIEVADEKTPDNAGSGLEAKIRQREGDRIRKHLSSEAYLIALAIQGTSMDSVEFSRTIDRLGIAGRSHIIFLIGGSLGLDESLLAEADLKLSFSQMTFPHQLMRVILLEQIYRGYRISSGQPYHK